MSGSGSPRRVGSAITLWCVRAKSGRAYHRCQEASVVKGRGSPVMTDALEIDRFAGAMVLRRTDGSGVRASRVSL